MNTEPTPKVLLAAIRANCLECCGGSRMEVRRCKIEKCRLWPYRNPETKVKKAGRKTGRTEAYKQLTIYELINEKNTNNKNL